MGIIYVFVEICKKEPADASPSAGSEREDDVVSSEELSLKSFIEEMKEVTDGFHPRRFCFVLGAGASKSSGIKTGQELVKIWDKELRERNKASYEQWRKELSITDENMSAFYSQYYEKRFCRCPTDGYNYIEKIMEKATPSAGYVMLAHLLTHTPHNVVITTNFDHLTEDAVNYYAQQTPLVIGHEALSHYVTGQPVRPTIIKIHRDLLFDPKNRSKDLEKLPDSWKIALALILSNYHPIFIGYAGNDKSLMDFLTENAEKFSNDEWKCPYWMIYKTDKLEGRVAEFLEGSRGFHIFHTGFDEVMIQLGAEFGYSVPKEEDFLLDARSRYKALADAIDAMSEPSMSDASKISSMTEDISGDKAAPSPAVLPPIKLSEDKEDVSIAIEKITSQSEQQRMYREASNYISTEQYSEAAKILELLIQLDGTNPRYHKSLGDAYFNLNKCTESLAEYSKVLKLEAPSAIIYLNIALVFLKEKQLEEAKAAVHQAVALGSDSDIDHFIAGNLLKYMNQTEEALDEYRKASLLCPDDGVYHRCIARMLKKLERNEKALEAVQEAIRCDPEYYQAYELMSAILRKLGRDLEADEAQNKAKELREAKEAGETV